MVNAAPLKITSTVIIFTQRILILTMWEIYSTIHLLAVATRTHRLVEQSAAAALSPHIISESPTDTTNAITSHKHASSRGHQTDIHTRAESAQMRSAKNI